MSSPAPTMARTLRRTLAVYGFALATLATLATGAVLVVSDGNIAAGQVRSNIGLNLISSAIFAVVFATLSSWIVSRNNRDEIVETVSTMADRVSREVSQIAENYLPLAQFPASDSFDDGYNRELMSAINGSKAYDFCGPSARFVAARLGLIRQAPQQIRIAMMDPGSTSSIKRRAADRQGWASSSGKSLNQLEVDFRRELLMTIVSLFDYRRTCPVAMVYTADAVVYRMELTDTALFFSWYHGPASAGREMPEAVRFSSTSMYYHVMTQEMGRRFEVLPKQILFTAAQVDTDLARHLTELTGETFTASELAKLRGEYDSYTADFRDYLSHLGS